MSFRNAVVGLLASFVSGVAFFVFCAMARRHVDETRYRTESELEELRAARVEMRTIDVAATVEHHDDACPTPALVIAVPADRNMPLANVLSVGPLGGGGDADMPNGALV